MISRASIYGYMRDKRAEFTGKYNERHGKGCKNNHKYFERNGGYKMSTSILKQLKPVVCDFLDKDGNILYEPSGRYIRINIKPDRIEFLRQFIDLLLNTKCISNETKMYISNRYMTISNVYEELKVSNKDINLNTVKAKIFYDKNKIAALFETTC